MFSSFGRDCTGVHEDGSDGAFEERYGYFTFVELSCDRFEMWQCRYHKRVQGTGSNRYTRFPLKSLGNTPD